MTIDAEAQVQQLKYARAFDSAGEFSIESHPKVDFRTPGQKDCDRILYSHAFLRLAGVTQIFPPSSSLPTLHNRLTHSLKVAQMARTVALRVSALAREQNSEDYIRSLGGIDPSVAEAAGLAHDLGHPPFGHAGERQLDELSYGDRNPVIETHTGFEGNAQSFRIAVKIDASHSPKYGLNLTAGVRAAILKYPWKRGKDGLAAKKFGYYLEDRDAFEEARSWVRLTAVGEGEQTLEASAMDIADDITYAVHDFEDFLSLGLIRSSTILFHCRNYLDRRGGQYNPIDDAARRLATNYPKGTFDEDAFKSACEAVLEQYLPNAQSSPQSLRFWRSNNLDYFMGSIEILTQPKGDKGVRIDLSSEAWHRVELFKALAKRYVIKRRETALLYRAGNAMIKNVLLALKDWTNGRPDLSELPMRFQLAKAWMLDIDGQIGRHYLDFICMLSDAELEDLSRALTGQALPKSV